MNNRFALLRRVVAGEPAAIKILVEQYQPVAYRVAMSILDNPERALAVSREAFIRVLETLNDVGEDVDFSVWLTHIVVEGCRRWLARRRQRRQWQRWRLGLSGFIAHPSAAAWKEWRLPAQSRPPQDLWDAFFQQEETDRLALILRYDHRMSVTDILLIIGDREKALQTHLFNARQRLLRFWLERTAGPGQGEFFELNGSHTDFQQLVQANSDHHISEANADRLNDHLKTCPSCQEYQRRFMNLEEELGALFHHCWDEQAESSLAFGPGARPVDFALTLQKALQRKNSPWQTANLVRVGLVAVTLIVGIMQLPALLSAQPLPPPVYALPDGTAAPTPLDHPTAFPLRVDAQLIQTIDPGLITFISRHQNGDDLMALRPNDSPVKNLARSYSIDAAPIWSPDGKKIAYLSSPDGVSANEIRVVNADGSGLWKVTPSLVSTGNENSTEKYLAPQSIYPNYGPPHWSPDSQNLVVSVKTSMKSAYLMLLPLSGQPPRLLSVDQPDKDLISWSPDGQTIAYVDHRDIGVWLWQPGLERTPEKNPRLINGLSSWDQIYGLAWSPDSRSFAVLVGNQQGTQTLVSLQNFQADSSTLEWMSILSNGTLDPGPLYHSGLAWSPDGKYLAFIPAFANEDLAHSRLFLIGADGSGMQTVAAFDQGVKEFSWSASGRWLLFSVDMNIWAASIAAFEKGQNYLVEIASEAGFGLAWQPIPLSTH